MTDALRIAVRDAVTDDLEYLAGAHRFAQESVSDARGGDLDTILRGRREPMEESFAADLADSTTTVRVGTADDLVVGHCVLRIEELPDNEKLGRIVELWVHPDARGIGVGSALMRDASETAISAGCRGIDARALPGDRATKNFFESFGLVARTIEVHKSFA